MCFIIKRPIEFRLFLLFRHGCSVSEASITWMNSSWNYLCAMSCMRQTGVWGKLPPKMARLRVFVWPPMPVLHVNFPNVTFHLLTTFFMASLSTSTDDRVIKSMALSSISEMNGILRHDCFLAKKYLVHLPTTKQFVGAQHQLEVDKPQVSDCQLSFLLSSFLVPFFYFFFLIPS